MTELEKLSDEELALEFSKGLSEAGDILLHRYKDSVRAKARLYFILGADQEDVVQEGMIGLFKAVRTYSPDRGAAFRTFADRCITASILTAVRAAGRLKHSPLNSALSLDSPLEDDPGQTLADVIASGSDTDPQELLVLAEAQSLIYDERSGFFSPFEYRVFELLCRGKNYREIGEALGKSPKSADNAIQRIRKKLRTVLI